MSSNDNLLQSIIRVRNRLSLVQDNAKFASILTHLLPRLLKRLDETWLEELMNHDSRQQQQQIVSHITGICSHVMERLRFWESRPKKKELPCPSFVSTLLPLLIVENHDTSRVLQSTTSQTVALSLLRVGVPCITAQEASSILQSVMGLVDATHDKVVACEQQETASSTTILLHYQIAGWILLDVLSILFGVDIRLDWDRQPYVAVSWSDLQARLLPPVAATTSTMHHGTFHFLLDMLLLDVTTTRQQAVEDDDEIRNDMHTGLSLRALERCTLRGTVWDETHLRQLQYILFKASSVVTTTRTSCQGRLLLDGDLALLLTIVAAANVNSIHGRYAASLLLNHPQSQRIMTLQKEVKNPQWTTTTQDSSCCSFALACTLLVLVIGDRRAVSILERHQDCRGQVESLLGPTPTNPLVQRSPLPHTVAERVVDFVLERFSLVSSLEECMVRLFVDLAAAVQERRNGIYWGIQLLEKVLFHERRIQVDACVETCLATAKKVLEMVPKEMQATDMPTGDDNLHLPLGVPEPFGHRKDLNRLIKNHRASQQNRLLAKDEAVMGRRTAYKMIAEMSNRLSGPAATRPSLSIMDLCNVVFPWTLHEGEANQKHLLGALESLLRCCKSMVASGNSLPGDDSLHFVAPLLPSLLWATTVDSSLAHLLVVQWTEELLVQADPRAAKHICTYLATEMDDNVARAASRVLTNAHVQASTPSISPATFTLFFDLSQPQVLLGDVADRIDSLAKRFSIPNDSLCMVLYDKNFSIQATADNLQNDHDATLRASGIIHRLDSVSANDEKANGRCCGICYDEDMNDATFYSLPCAHMFCQSCWVEYISTAMESKATTMTMTCPYHECGERLLRSDIAKLCPEKLPAWSDAFLASVIDRSKEFRRCPGVDCNQVCYFSSSASEPSAVARKVACPACSTSFCFGCGQEPHQPATCQHFDSWNRVLQSSNTIWVKKHSKPCPTCSVPIEKNDGCNHMACSQCGCNFCWVCLSLLRSHNEPHICNRYDPLQHADNVAEERALFYTSRYQAHDEAGDFARAHVRKLGDDLALQDRLWYASDEELEALLEAAETLVGARNFLKFSYVAAWALQDKNEKECFELLSCYQATLETVTERCSYMVLKNLDTLYHEQGRLGIKAHFRSLGFLSDSLKEYMERIRQSQSDTVSC